MKKSLLTVLLVLTLAVFLLPAAQAGYYYTMDENGVVTFHDGVTRIPSQTFMNNPFCPEVTRVIIPDSVTYIDWGVFTNCPNLTSVTIPASVAEFYGASTFSSCPGLKTAGPIGSGCNIEFGWTETIPDYAFKDCALTSVTIPESVTDIGVNAFGTLWLKDMGDFPVINGILVKYQGSDSDVVIPEGVTRIGPGAFRGCTLTSITIPDSVTSIGRQAFNGCKGLTSVTFPDSVTRIEKQAFMGCSGLSDVTLGSGVTSIGVEAFRDCTGLTSITIPDSVTSIEGGAFYYCKGLRDVTLGSGVTSITNSAFDNCPGLTSIQVDAGNQSYTTVDRMLFTKDMKTLVRCPEGKYAYGYYPLPDGVTSIGDRAFYNCANLYGITIPDSVTRIGDHAFSGAGLGDVTIPSSVTTIGKDAFSRCVNLDEIIDIPGSVTSIGDSAFYYCPRLPSVTIANGVTSIGAHAFSSCTSLTSITIPDSVTAIGVNAFYNCQKLTVYGSASAEAARYCGENNIPFVETVDGFVIEAGTAIKYIGPGGDVMIPDGVVGIGAGAFAYRDNLTSVTIPESVTAIDRMAFDATFYLTAIHVAEGNPVYSSQDGVLFNKDKTELVAYSGGRYQQYVIPDSVTTIGEHAFADCDLAGVVIPDSVTSIGDYAFFNCHKLVILIPDSVTSIGVEAFLESNSNSTMVYGYEGCYAQQYCAENNISFVPIKRYPPSAGETRTITDERWGVSITFDGLLREDTHVYLSTDFEEYYRQEFTFYVLREGSTVRIEALPGREYGAPVYYYDASEEEQNKYVWAPTGFGMEWRDEDRLFVGYYSSEPIGLNGPITEIALPEGKGGSWDGEGLELIYGNKHYGMYLCESDFAHLVPALTEEMFTVDAAEEAYTGQAVTKTVTGQDGDKVLTEGVDYTVTYTDNVDLGTATMTIAGIGGYTGTLEYTFDIVEVVHTGSMEGDGRSLDWSCSGTGQVTLKGEIKENEMVLVACYDEQGKLTELKRLTRDEMTARMKAGADRIKLFWLGEGQTPLSESATIWGK